MDQAQTSNNQAPVSSVNSNYASFWQRVGAAFIDALIVGVVSSLIVAILDLGKSNNVSLVLGWLYYAFMESSDKQATFGKQTLGLKVTDMNGARISFGRATGRHFSKILSSLIIFIGFLMVIWTQKKQGLHDIIAKTLVVKK